jgi:hypothetical protein
MYRSVPAEASVRYHLWIQITRRRDILLIAKSQRLVSSDQPSRALTTTLLAIHNMTFQDALGRHPRVLPFDAFSSYKVPLTAEQSRNFKLTHRQVFQGFLDDSFATIPGRRWVELGSFILTNASTGKRLTADNWSTSISRGCLINMDMLMPAHKNPQEGGKCVIRGCTGALQRDDISPSWNIKFSLTLRWSVVLQ